jgi:hypothetical protein
MKNLVYCVTPPGVVASLWAHVPTCILVHIPYTRMADCDSTTPVSEYVVREYVLLVDESRKYCVSTCTIDPTARWVRN